MKSSPQKIAVIGGGLSGLSLAYYLQKNENVQVTVFEKENWGGLIQTIDYKNELVELAANGFLSHSEVLKVADEIGAKVTTAPKKLNRYIFRNKPSKFPISVMACFALVGFVFKFIFMKNSIKPRELETMQDWGYRVLGKEVTNYLLEPAMRGIFAGDLSKLSASVWFQRFLTKKSTAESKERAKGLISFEKGMGEYLMQLKSYLQNKPNVILENKIINDIKEILNDFDTFVIATAPPQAASLIATQNFNVAKMLQKIEMRKIACVTLFLNEPSPLKGYGCLFPNLEKFTALGILWSRDIFPVHGTRPVERWMLLWDGKENDAELLRRVQSDRAHLYAKELPMPQEYHIQKWEQGLPHMTLELEKILPQISLPFLTQNGKKIYLHGNYLGKMGTTDLVLKSKALAEEIV